MLINKPVQLGNLYNKEVCPPGTFSLDSSKWIKHFSSLKENPLQMDASGCYCFFYKGTKEQLNKYNQTHWIKGKQTALDDPRLIDSSSQVVFVEMRAPAWNAKDQSEKPVYHIYHKIDWNFEEVEIDKETYVPLYVGKSSHLFKRVNLHFSWPNDVDMYEDVEVVKIEEGVDNGRTTKRLPRVMKHERNTVAQFRAGFKFLARCENKYAKENPLSLSKDIYLGIATSPFDDVAERFFQEDQLIGRYRPPFNIDSER